MHIKFSNQDASSEFTWNISKGSTDTIVRVVNDKRASLLDSSPVPHFTFACPESFRSVNLITKILQSNFGS